MVFEGVITPGEHVIPNGHNVFKIAVLLVLLLVAFLAGHYGAIAIDHHLGMNGWRSLLGKWSWLLLCGTLASVAVQGLGILAHDAVHKVLVSKSWINELLGGMISAFALLPFNANRQFHMMHHRFSHQKDADPEQPMHKHNLVFAITVGSFIALVLQYRILINNLFQRQFEWRDVSNALKDVGYICVTMSIYLVILPLSGLAIQNTFVPMLLTLPLVFGMRAISDHYGLPAIRGRKTIIEGRRESNTILNEVSGWVVRTTPVVEWLWSSVNYHEVHHKFPYLSHLYLKKTFAATHDKLPYVVADGYLRNLWRHRHRDYYNRELPESD